jgi:hypothetical protein
MGVAMNASAPVAMATPVGVVAPVITAPQLSTIRPIPTIVPLDANNPTAEDKMALAAYALGKQKFNITEMPEATCEACQ